MLLAVCDWRDSTPRFASLDPKSSAATNYATVTKSDAKVRFSNIVIIPPRKPKPPKENSSAVYKSQKNWRKLFYRLQKLDIVKGSVFVG